MREILFRGKAINRDYGCHRTNYKNGDWVYGLVTRLYDERFENLPAEMTNVNGIEGIEVDYKTIGQYTGLIDKNGKKIFEGDILKSEPDEYIGVVKYNEIIASFVGEINDTTPEFYHYSLLNKGDVSRTTQLKETVVIGNIHDNPELLKVGDENDT